MRAAMIYGPGDIRVEDRAEPTIVNPTDALIRLTTTCVCGSDLWPYRGIVETEHAHPIGHEYVGIVEEIGTEVTGISVGDRVVGSFMTSDNTCEICVSGCQSRCVHGTNVGSAQAERFTVENADGTLVPIPGTPTKAQEASLMVAQLGAERIIAMSRQPIGNGSPVSSVPLTSSPLAEMRESPGSRNSRAASALIPSSKPSARRSRSSRRSVRPDPADPRRSANICPTSSTSFMNDVIDPAMDGRRAIKALVRL